MQTNKGSRKSLVQSTGVKNYHARSAQQDNRSTFALLSTLCILIPPAGILLTWRAQKLTLAFRAAFSAVGLAATVLIFSLLMRPDSAVSDIRPMPETPRLIGYGTAANETLVVPSSAAVPAQPGIVSEEPQATTEPVYAQEPGELTDDTIVFAVTNNASSYHLHQVCDMQENNRAMTLRDALNEGLAPCEKCVDVKG